MTYNILGIDIGGTKCAVSYGIKDGHNLTIVEKLKFPTTGVDETIAALLDTTAGLMAKHGLDASNTGAIGISCGGPLNSETGMVMSPPNLPGWDNIPIVKLFNDKFGVPTGIHNDANACALAEWKFGAGIGTRNMAFLTFGTGLGAGLILNGKLYTGTNDNAGELGHIRLSDFGPVGFGKAGSFEGFCSGGGIAQLAQFRVAEKKQMGEKVTWCPPEDIEKITALTVAIAASEGDALALDIYRTSAEYLGRGLSVLIDILNPERIIIGGVYARNAGLMFPDMMDVIRREALPGAVGVCEVVPAGLGEQIGDYAALSVAADIVNGDHHV